MPLLSQLLSAGALKHASVCWLLLGAALPAGQSEAAQVTLTALSSSIL